MDLTSLLSTMLSVDSVGSISQTAGVSIGEAQSVLGSALPSLLNGALAQSQSSETAEGFDNAQVTAGGIRTSGFNPETLESWFCPGLFACGELLDVDGDCGGYNLQWAWASGRLAGRLGR